MESPQKQALLISVDVSEACKTDIDTVDSHRQSRSLNQSSSLCVSIDQ